MKGRPMMTLRVSRDSGKTYGPTRVIRSTEPLMPLETSVWPPCQCPRCVSALVASRQPGMR
ncbi:hypothetical protein Strvi_7428 [Streptomyces violaceusniger Tu 4113]|uniref:Sialidase domain-containing protein n=1 Tax=Streptomyces violaceusniger (strain Tu 4113) TaxID=653045 RepID=G2P6W8_STRV4|nr:hypothetical protein Strvi_7428 [Streptomyces violaceusniger Tu 4113]